MRRHLLVLALIVIASAAPAVALSQTLTGTIQGKITDEQGGVLPGASVTLVGKTGTQTQVTDTKGEFRFVALSPGDYDVKAELQGFKPKGETGIDVGANRTIEVRLALSVGGLSETVEVTASAVTVDTKTTATDTNIGSNLLFAMPISRTNAAVNTLNYAPGVNSGAAFGGNADYGNALLLDGVDTRDPEGGSAWTFFNYNIIEEVQIGGLGQPAEYGGFTGAVVNTITKSGGNRFSTLFEMRYTSHSYASSNVSDAVVASNPSLENAVLVRKLTDYTVQLGGRSRKTSCSSSRASSATQSTTTRWARERSTPRSARASTPSSRGSRRRTTTSCCRSSTTTTTRPGADRRPPPRPRP